MSNKIFATNISKRTAAALLSAVMLLSSSPAVLGSDSLDALDAALPENVAITNEATSNKSSNATPHKDQDLIEYSNAIANAPQTYYPKADRSEIAIENSNMSLRYGLIGKSRQMLVNSLSNSKGKTYIENTFDIFVQQLNGTRYYASDSFTGANVNIYRYGYYYYENRIEGQVFSDSIIGDSYHYVDLSTTQTKNNILYYQYYSSTGSARLFMDSKVNDVFWGYNTKDKDGNNLKAADYDTLEIKIRAQNVTSTLAQIFVVAGNETTYTSAQSTSFTFIADGEYNVYQIPLSDIPGYTDDLKMIRIDVNGAAYSYIDLEYVRLFKARPTGLGNDLSIQRSFLNYSDKLHHLTQFSTNSEINNIHSVGSEIKIDSSTVNKIIVKDANGYHTSLNDDIHWDSAEYVGFDIAEVGIFGYILPADNKSGELQLTLEDGIYRLQQILEIESNKFTPSKANTRNANDVFFGQRLYTDENHDFAAFIAEAECERHPLTAENISVDLSEDGGSKFTGYDPLYGFYNFSIGGTGFNQSYYDHPNRQYSVRFTVNGDDRDRQMYFMTRCTSSGSLETAVLLDDRDMLLPVPMEVSKNFSGDGENTIYNIDDALYGETFFPVIVGANETRTYNVINAYQNWGRFPLKQISSIQFHTPYYHLSTGVTETNCIVPLPECGPGLPDHRAMSAPFWANQPQHNSGGSHNFLRFYDESGNYISSQTTGASIDSYGPTYCDLTLNYVTSDGRISAEYTHTEMPQTDENRGYYEMKYTFNEDVSFEDFASEFIFYRVTDNNPTGVYQLVGFLDENNCCQVVAAVSGDKDRKEYVLGDQCPYFSFFYMPDYDKENKHAEGYTNLSMLFYDWTVIAGGEEVEPNLLLINTKNYLTLSMDVGKISFKAGDSITINAILMPWGSQEMDPPTNDSDRIEGRVYYDSVDEYGMMYLDKNVRAVRENTLLDPLTPKAIADCEVIDSVFVPKLRSTNGQSATFTLSGGYNNQTVRVYGFDKLTVPYIEELVNGVWVEYEVSSRNAPDAYNYANSYDGYMVHYDDDGSFSYSFVVDMTDNNERSFRVSAKKDFEGWLYNPLAVREAPMNVYVDAKAISSKARSPYYFKHKQLIENDSAVRLTLQPTGQDGSGNSINLTETFISMYSGNVSTPTGQYVVYKYRIPTTNQKSTGTLEVWTSTKNTGAVDGDNIKINSSAVIADGEWHVMVIDVPALKQTRCTFDKNEFGAYCAKYLRIDTSNGTMAEGDYIDIAYVGFADSLDEIIAANQDVERIDYMTALDKIEPISTKDYVPQESSCTLSLQSASQVNGREFTIALYASGDAALNYLRAIPHYDPNAFELIRVQNGELLDNMTEIGGNFIWDGTQNSAKSGTVASFTFKVKEKTAIGEYQISFSVVDSFGKETGGVPMASEAAKISVIDFDCGDVNGDRIVDLIDVVILRQYLADYDFETGKSSVEVYPGADVNCDESIDSKDVTAIVRYLAYYDYDSGASVMPIGVN